VTPNKRANTFFYGKVIENHELGSDFFVLKRIISALKRVGFFSDRMSYILLRGCWCDSIVLNVHALTDDKIDDMKDGFDKNWKVDSITCQNTIWKYCQEISVPQ
jgi:hypothetical protein